MDVLSTRALARDDAARVWRRLDELRPPALAASWRWTEAWLDHFGDPVEPELVAVERDGDPVAVALLTRATVRRKRVPVREAHVGTAGEPAGETVFVERNALHAAPEDRAAVAAALVEHLRAGGGWDVLKLDGFEAPDAGALADAHGAMTLDRQASPYADLGAARDTGTDAVAALRKGPRQRVRRTLKAFGELRLEWAETPAEATDVLDELIALHQQRWTAAGEPGAFSSERFTAFHRSLLERLEIGREVILVRASGADGTVGCLLCHTDGGRVLFYQSGLRRFEDRNLRAGLATHALAMQACLERGFTHYDFLAGEARYKDELATGSDVLCWGEGSASGVRARVLAAGVSALRRRG